MEIPDSTRLKFHFMTAVDEERFYELDSDPEVMRHITGRAATREEIRDSYIPRLQEYADQQRGWGLWGMTRLDTDQYIGWILVRPIYFFDPTRRDDDDLELGWRLFRSQWGKGFATEGARSVMDTLRANRACKRFSANTVKANTASINVMQKLGMTYVKEELEQTPYAGEVLCVVYSCSTEAGSPPT